MGRRLVDIKLRSLIKTHIDFNVEVLEVECVLPNVDADDRHVGQQRVLVGSGDNFQALSGGVQSLPCTSENARILAKIKLTSHPQPDPWIPAVVVLNSFLRLSKLPKD